MKKHGRNKFSMQDAIILCNMKKQEIQKSKKNKVDLTQTRCSSPLNLN
jgi:hypothetical protein